MQSKESITGWLRWVLADVDRTARCRSLLYLILAAAVAVVVAAVALLTVLLSRVPASGDYLYAAGGLAVSTARICAVWSRKASHRSVRRDIG